MLNSIINLGKKVIYGYNFVTNWLKFLLYKLGNQNTKRAVDILFYLSSKTETRIDDKAVSAIAKIIDYLQSINDPEDDERNELRANFISKDQKHFKEVDLKYDIKSRKFSVGMFGMNFDYDLNNRKVGFGKTIEF